MRFSLLIILILILGFIIQSFLPWWSIMLVAGILTLFFQLSTTQRSLAGFLGVFLLWGSYAIYLNMLNSGILAEKMGMLFGGLGGMTLVLITAIVGGLFGGLGAMTASLGYALFNK